MLVSEYDDKALIEVARKMSDAKAEYRELRI